MAFVDPLVGPSGTGVSWDTRRTFDAMQKQLGSSTVRVFTSTTLRDETITSPKAGQVVYLDTGDAAEGLYIWHGSAWRAAAWNAPWGVQLYKQQTSGTQSITTTATTLTNMTGSVSVVNNRLYRVHAQIYYSNTTAGAVNTLALRQASTVFQSQQFVAPNTVNGFGVNIVGYYQAASTAAVTFDATVQAASGTIVSTPTTSFVNQFIVEDIGPAGAPA